MHPVNSDGNMGGRPHLGFIQLCQNIVGLCSLSLDPARHFLVELMHEFPERLGFEGLNLIKLTL